MFRKVKIILLIVLLSLIFLLSLPLPISKRLKSKVIDISYPLLKTSAYVAQKISSLKQRADELFKTAGENKKLHEELTELRNRMNQTREAVSENRRLRELLDLKASIGYKTITCMIIGRDASTWFKTLIIDKGAESQIKPDLPVISTGGVVGRIISCSRKTATVLLITDANSGIGAMIQDNRIVGLLEGHGTGECILNYIPKKADVPVGAAVVTSGLGSIFPKGLVIGRVTQVQMDSQNLYKIASVELAAHIDRVEEVLVLKD